MAIITIDELFQRAQAFEENLENFYVKIRDESENNGVRLVTYYLARNRRHLQRVLDDFEPGDVLKVKNVQLKFGIDFSPALDVTVLKPASINARQLLEAAAVYDAALIELYKNILKQPIGRLAQMLLESLLKVEERDIVLIKKNDCHGLFLKGIAFFYGRIRTSDR